MLLLLAAECTGITCMDYFVSESLQSSCNRECLRLGFNFTALGKCCSRYATEDGSIAIRDEKCDDFEGKLHFLLFHRLTVIKSMQESASSFNRTDNAHVFMCFRCYEC